MSSEQANQGVNDLTVARLADAVRAGDLPGVRTMLEAEVEAYLPTHRDARDPDGHALVVRNGKSRLRTLTTSLGDIGIRAPRVDDRRTDAAGRRAKFVSRVLSRMRNPARPVLCGRRRVTVVPTATVACSAALSGPRSRG